MIVSELISKKRNGLPLSKEEIQYLVLGFTQGTVADYQMSAFMMAVYFQNMSDEEIYFLTDAMLNSGKKMDFSKIGMPTADKHSTGGVGDKTSLVIGPIVSSYQVGVPMIAGRGLGHTGGTIDKLESIPGLSCQVDLARFELLIKKNRFALIAQTPKRCMHFEMSRPQ
jgi:pyrimidine-nucleoside phosphorylase